VEFSLTIRSCLAIFAVVLNGSSAVSAATFLANTSGSFPIRSKSDTLATFDASYRDPSAKLYYVGLGRSSGPSVARTAILVGGAFVTGLVTLMSIGGIITDTVGPGAWVTVAIEALLTGGFFYFSLVGRVSSQGEAKS
jgi:hypothetical protein